mgnify:CR=1 FL=1
MKKEIIATPGLFCDSAISSGVTISLVMGVGPGAQSIALRGCTPELARAAADHLLQLRVAQGGGAQEHRRQQRAAEHSPEGPAP